MRKNYIVKLVLSFLLGISLVSCQNNGPKDSTNISPEHDRPDTSLNYLLKPVNEQVTASIPVIRATYSSNIYVKEVQGRVTYDTRNESSLSSRVSGRIEKLYVKYNYQPVTKGQLILEIYSPDLAAAQRELLLIKRTGDQDQMLEPAKQRLKLLGMTGNAIDKLLRTGEVSYKIPLYSNATGYILEKQAPSSSNQLAANAGSSGASSSMNNMDGTPSGTGSADQLPIASASSAILLREGEYLSAGQRVFTIYRTGNLVAEFSLIPGVAAKLNKQDKVLVQRTADKQESIVGKIGLIQPVFNAGENFVMARVYLQKNNWQVGELVTGQFPFLTEKSYWLPREAALSIGNESVIFKKEGKVFIPTVVKVGISQNNQIQILEVINGWDVAKNAYYLIDSESFIKIKRKETN